MEKAPLTYGEAESPGIKAMLLSNEERTKFAQWCEQEATSTRAILQQMEKLKMPEAVTKKQRIELAAVSVVYKMLTSGEQQTIGGSDDSKPEQNDGPNSR